MKNGHFRVNKPVILRHGSWVAYSVSTRYAGMGHDSGTTPRTEKTYLCCSRDLLKYIDLDLHPDLVTLEYVISAGRRRRPQKLMAECVTEKSCCRGSGCSGDVVLFGDGHLGDGDYYIINGRKWWTSGAMDPRCKLLIVMGKTNFSGPQHKQQSMILVDIKTPGVDIKRPLMVFGFDDAPHGHAEVSFQNVRVPARNILLGEGRGFEIAQGRLGPGRLHHCMRLVGAAERGMQMMVERAAKRRVFGKLIAEQGSFLSDIAKCRIEIEKTRLLVLEAADQLDRLGNKKARGTIAMAKVAAPTMALHVLDKAIQVHGALGVSSDTVLAHLWATSRTLRIADGPDEVHLGTIAKLELRKSRL
ncbi:hypothetical protein KSS87_015577 [Heliosperma pusillum]|nr:hypothetical protein KSS87_015577 [Heliosperma pusillum]